MESGYYKSDLAAYRASLFRRPPEEYFAIVKAKFPQIIVSGEYINQKSRLNAKCSVCGHEWAPIADVLIHSKGCPKCTRASRGRKSRKTHETFIQQLSQVNPNIKVLNHYEKATTRIECECSVCGHLWSAKASNLLSGFGCPQCGRLRTSNSHRKSQTAFEEAVKSVNPNIDVVGVYASNRTPIQCRCIICGCLWNGLPFNILRGEGCPACRMSHGEKEIVKYLDDSRIEYVPQYSFSNLRGVKGGTLSYDFYVPAHNMLIEYQGIQHYRPVAAFGGEEQFDVQLEHDERKRQYANENGYLLVEIRYDQINNIENILNTVLNQNTISNPCIDHSL